MIWRVIFPVYFWYLLWEPFFSRMYNLPGYLLATFVSLIVIFIGLLAAQVVGRSIGFFLPKKMQRHRGFILTDMLDGQVDGKSCFVRIRREGAELYCDYYHMVGSDFRPGCLKVADNVVIDESDTYNYYTHGLLEVYFTQFACPIFDWFAFMDEEKEKKKYNFLVTPGSVDK